MPIRVPLFVFGTVLALLAAGCSGVGSPADSSDNGSGPVTEGQSATYGSIPGGSLVAASPSGGSDDNVVSITIGEGEICGNYNNGGTLNQPCTTVTICAPGSTTECQTITDILVDTGSYGLRVFASALYDNLIQSLTQTTDSSGNPIAECAQFGTGQDWGPVMLAGVQLGTEPVISQIPIQVINRSFSYAPGACAQADTSPTAAGFNGILGVGLLRYDCGEGCVADPGLGNLYFSCSGASCSGTAMTLANQVQNPVASLPVDGTAQDDNGVSVVLPSLPGDQAVSTSGTLYLGIGTRSNNEPDGVTLYSADSVAEFETEFNSISYPQSFIDSGSNVLFFTDSSLNVCDDSTEAPGFFCPGSTTGLTATTQGENLLGTPEGSTGTIAFNIADAGGLVETDGTAFDDIGADASSSGFPDSFDWGLPFFFGRAVYVGIDGEKSSLGTGPYWAY